MKIVTAEQRLAFIRQDVTRLLEILPVGILDTTISEHESLAEVLNNISVASDTTDQEPSRWLVTWFEVYRYDEENIENMASFDTEKQAIDFMYNYSLMCPDAQLSYDEWQSNADGTGKQLYKK